MKTLYVDTNVFLSCWFNEFKKRIVPSGYYAEQLFEQAVGCKFLLIISDQTIKELLNKLPFTREELDSKYLSVFLNCDKMRISHLDTEVMKRAETIHAHPPDNLHIAMALKEDAVLVSNDELMLEEAQKIGIPAVTPEELVLD